MTSITIAADENLMAALQSIAEKKATTLETVAREALTTYVRSHPVGKRAYSFIGIGRSGKGKISKEIEPTLEQAANRREGWSLR